MDKRSFTGDKKLPLRTLLSPYERRFIDSLVGRFPKWIEGYHLTLTTILWSVGTAVFGYLAASTDNLHWLWGSSLMLVLQWFTDCFDGALGRFRDTGIPKWGFYMDHFLDYLFVSSILVGYSFMMEGVNKQIVYFLIPICGAYMVSAYLAFGATGEFKITYLRTGPTEMRIFFVLLNTSFIIFGTGCIERILLYVLAGAIILMCIVIFRTQKYIWAIDTEDKRQRLEGKEDTESPVAGK